MNELGDGGDRVRVILDWSCGSSEDTAVRILDGVSSTAEEKLIESGFFSSEKGAE